MGNTPNEGTTIQSKNIIRQSSIKQSIASMKSLYESLNKPLSQSVFDLVNCFICLNPASNPVSCPKCNNFACRECFVKCFKGQSQTDCPLCKQEIYSYQLENKRIIEEIGNILEQNQNKQEIIEQLSKLAEDKKKFWDEQETSVNKFLKRLDDYEKIFVGYMNAYEVFFKDCLNMTTKRLNNFHESINKLRDSLLSFNKIYQNKEFEDFKTKNKNYDNKIKEQIKEILSLERKYFNEKSKGEMEKLLYEPQFCAPSLVSIRLDMVKLEKYNSYFITEKTDKSRNACLGMYELKYSQVPETRDVNCLFSFTLDNDIDISVFVIQSLEENEGYEQNTPMKFIKKEGLKYYYQCTIPFDLFKNGINRGFKMITRIKLYSI